MTPLEMIYHADALRFIGICLALLVVTLLVGRSGPPEREKECVITPRAYGNVPCGTGVFKHE